MRMVWPCYGLLMTFLRNSLTCIKKKVTLINNDCLPILMLSYIMLYVMLAYLMLFVYIMLIFLLLIFAKAFCFHGLSWFIDIVCLFQLLFYITYSAFNLLIFPNSMFTPFF